LRSRCLNIRIPSPSIKDMCSIIFDISCREGINIDQKNLCKIANLANGNMKKAISLLELYGAGIRNFLLSWKCSIKDIINIILEFNDNPTDQIFNENQILNLRTILYLIYVSGINESHMIIEFTKCFITNSSKIDPQLNNILIQLIGYYDTRINKGTRFIIHLETLIMSIFYHIKAFKMNKLKRLKT
jgi:replication factor C subunit 3/5